MNERMKEGNPDLHNYSARTSPDPLPSFLSRWLQFAFERRRTQTIDIRKWGDTSVEGRGLGM